MAFLLLLWVILSNRQKEIHANSIKVSVDIWHTGRDSNPQPSEPESDALSIEPPVRLLDSQVIIAGFNRFVKGDFEKTSGIYRTN